MVVHVVVVMHVYRCCLISIVSLLAIAAAVRFFRGVTHQIVVVCFECVQVKVDEVHFFVRLGGFGGRERRGPFFS